MSCLGIEHQDRALEASPSTDSQVVLRDISAPQMNENCAAVVESRPVGKDILDVGFSEIALGEALVSMRRDPVDLFQCHFTPPLRLKSD